MRNRSKAAPLGAVLAVALSLGGCVTTSSNQVSLSDRDCLARAMYFESNRSSEDGMLAVGSVVMNRLQSPEYPKTICAVVGQPRQFADGALSKPVSGRSWQLAQAAADKVMGGDRHDEVGGAMFFHTAGYTFPYRNMAYVAAAGGNVFYEKRPAGTFDRIHPSTLVAREDRGRGTAKTQVASRVEEDEAGTPTTFRRRGRPSTATRVAARDEEDEAPARRSRRGAREDRNVREEERPVKVASAGNERRARKAAREERLEAEAAEGGPLPPSRPRRQARAQDED